MGQVVAEKKSARGVLAQQKHEKSPFLDKLEISTKGRKVTVARGSSLVDLETGEVSGITEIAQVVQVDDEAFIKLFTKDLAVWFDLSRAGLRVFGALLTTVQTLAIGVDIVFFDVRSESLAAFKISKTTFYRGLDELIEKGFIARHLSAGWFFINPAIFFNGDRARFVKEYRRKSKIKTEAEKIEEAIGQQRLALE